MQKRVNMATLRLPKEKELLQKIFNINLAVIEVRPGETEDEAWNRHLTEHPGDLNANIRVFNRHPIRVTNNA